ncbi:MAG TPA: hypothetical protein VFX19_04535, partial [Dehalococcoidia bacterium]|nr:hypothetical protein [Dehalococcoidia bacterium]
PRLSADDEAALIAELQRYVQRNAGEQEATAAGETAPVASPETPAVSEAPPVTAPQPIAETPMVQEWSLERTEPAPQPEDQAEDTPPVASEAFRAEMERFAMDLEDPGPGKPQPKATDGWQPL